MREGWGNKQEGRERGKDGGTQGCRKAERKGVMQEGRQTEREWKGGSKEQVGKQAQRERWRGGM